MEQHAPAARVRHPMASPAFGARAIAARLARRFVETIDLMARPERFELPTLCFEGRCSIQLSYGRNFFINRLRCSFPLCQGVFGGNSGQHVRYGCKMFLKPVQPKMRIPVCHRFRSVADPT